MCLLLSFALAAVCGSCEHFRHVCPQCSVFINTKKWLHGATRRHRRQQTALAQRHFWKWISIWHGSFYYWIIRLQTIVKFNVFTSFFIFAFRFTQLSRTWVVQSSSAFHCISSSAVNWWLINILIENIYEIFFPIHIELKMCSHLIRSNCNWINSTRSVYLSLSLQTELRYVIYFMDRFMRLTCK